MKSIKKLFVIAAMLLMAASASNAQEAFKHLSIGLEAGTTGAGVELALPVVTDHLILKAGYNFPNIKFSANPKVDLSAFSSEINDYVNEAQFYLDMLPDKDKLQTMPSSTNVSTDAKINLGTAKAMLEYYPSKKSSFHITAGVYVGTSSQLATFDCAIPELWSIYEADVAIVNKPANKAALSAAGVEDIPEAKFSMEGKSYKITDGTLNAGIKIAKARPYLGIGFGRSVPKKHCACQVDLGVWYHGKPQIESKNQVTYSASDPDLGIDISVLGKAVIYPQLSVRFIYRIF